LKEKDSIEISEEIRSSSDTSYSKVRIHFRNEDEEDDQLGALRIQSLLKNGTQV
jgi:hypothetical protein